MGSLQLELIRFRLKIGIRFIFWIKYVLREDAK